MARKYVEEWDRPPEVVPGFTVAYKILTPWTSPVTPMATEGKKLVEISNVQDGHANETAIFIVHPGPWDLKGAQVIWTAQLSDGGTLVLTKKDIPMPEMPPPRKIQPRYFEGRTESDLASEGLRMLAATTDANGHRVFIDARVVYAKDRPDG